MSNLEKPLNFKSRVVSPLKKKQEADEASAKSFLDNINYFVGDYLSATSFTELNNTLNSTESSKLREGGKRNRLYYLAIPPEVFTIAASHLSKICSNESTGFTRIAIERPFGKDSATSAELSEGLLKLFREDQIFRIDHYLGKMAIQNLLILRFGNLFFEPLWNRANIANVQITFSDSNGVTAYGKYFDNYGIIRDVMVNHLMQVLALICMEQPVNYVATQIRNEKRKVLRAIKPLRVEDLVLGQYTKPKVVDPKAKLQVGYTEEVAVAKNSVVPTFAAAVLYVNNQRWSGVPFLLKAGKGLEYRKTEIRVLFNEVPANIFKSGNQYIPLTQNELIITVKPQESITLNIMNKIPGLDMQIANTVLDLKKETDTTGIDAYSRLMLDVIGGDQSFFVSTGELAEVWNIFTPVLQSIEKAKTKPIPYAFGSRGPSESDYLAQKNGAKWKD